MLAVAGMRLGSFLGFAILFIGVPALSWFWGAGCPSCSGLGVSPASVPAWAAMHTCRCLNRVRLSDPHPKTLAVICSSPSTPRPGWDALQARGLAKLLFYLVLLVLRAALTRADRFEIADLRWLGLRTRRWPRRSG